MKSATFPLLILLLLLLTAACQPAGLGQSPERLLAQGNGAFEAQSYDEAWQHYDAAQAADPGWTKAIYNAANTRYRQGAFDQAQQLLQQVVDLASEELAQHGFYNLGNGYFQVKQWGTAVEAYKNALRLDPNDQEAKYNLELALEQLQEQQDQQQEQEQQEEEQEQDQENQDQDQQEQDQPEENQDQQDQENQGQDQGRPDLEQNQDQQDQENQGQDQGQPDLEQEQSQDQPADPAEADQSGGSQPQPSEGLTAEQARQLFGSVGQSTETLQEKLQQIFVVPAPPPAKDW